MLNDPNAIEQRIFSKAVSHTVADFELWIEQLRIGCNSEAQRIKFLARVCYSSSFVEEDYRPFYDLLMERYPVLRLALNYNFHNKLTSQPTQGQINMSYVLEFLKSDIIDFKYKFGAVLLRVISADSKALSSEIAEASKDCVRTGLIEFISFYCGYFSQFSLFENLREELSDDFFAAGLAQSDLKLELIPENIRNIISKADTSKYNKNHFAWKLLNQNSEIFNSPSSRLVEIIKSLGGDNSDQISLDLPESFYEQIGEIIGDLIKNTDELHALVKSGVLHEIPQNSVARFLLGFGRCLNDKSKNDNVASKILISEFNRVCRDLIVDTFIAELKTNGISALVEDYFDTYNMQSHPIVHELYLSQILSLSADDFYEEWHGDHIIQIYSKNPDLICNHAEEIASLCIDFAKKLFDHINEDIRDLQAEIELAIVQESDLAGKFQSFEVLQNLKTEFAAVIRSHEKRAANGKRSYQDLDVVVELTGDVSSVQVVDRCLEMPDFQNYASPEAKKRRLFDEEMITVYDSALHDQSVDYNIFFAIGGLRYFLANPTESKIESLLEFCQKFEFENEEFLNEIFDLQLIKQSKNLGLTLEVLSAVSYIVTSRLIGEEDYLPADTTKFEFLKKLNNDRKFLFILSLACNSNSEPLNFECFDLSLQPINYLIRILEIDLVSAISEFKAESLDFLFTRFLSKLLEMLTYDNDRKTEDLRIFIESFIRHNHIDAVKFFSIPLNFELSETFSYDMCMIIEMFHKKRLFPLHELEELYKYFEKWSNEERYQDLYDGKNWGFAFATLKEMIMIERDPSLIDKIKSRKLSEFQKEDALNRSQVSLNSLLVGFINIAFDRFPIETIFPLLERKEKYDAFFQNTSLTVEYLGDKPSNFDILKSVKSYISNLGAFCKSQIELQEISSVLNTFVKFYER